MKRKMLKAIGLLCGVLLTVGTSVTAFASANVTKPVGERAVVYGDVNQDGQVTAEDANMVRDYVLGKYSLTKSQCVAADVNGDNEIDSLDYTILNKYILKQSDSLPLGNTKKVIYGDLDDNGVVDSNDSYLMNGIIQGKVSPNFYQTLVSDVNGDNKINSTDYELIEKRVMGGIPYFDTEVENKILYGDVNGDGDITEADANLLRQNVLGESPLTKAQFIAADVNEDGEVDILDYIKLNDYVINKKSDVPLLGTEKEIVYGDVNGDNNVTQEDWDLIQQNILGTSEFSNAQKIAADLNGDSRINSADLLCLRKYLK